MHAKLTCKTGPLAGSVYYVDQEAVIGSGNDCAIQIKSGIVSTHHTRLTYDAKKDGYILEDLKSFNGTRLDGEDLHGKKRLKSYHIIVLANSFEFVFQLVPKDEVAPSSAAPAPALSDDDKMARTILLNVEAEPILKAAAVEAGPLFLQFTVTRGGKQTRRLKQGENTLGRSTSSDIVIDHPSISRHHAVLTLAGDTVRVRDAGSRNGTFVDERQLTEETVVAPEQGLRFGLVDATLVRGTPQGQTPS
jgi:pSer/pThr/pTyr-binding forkhead associated (FHA) protein